MYLHVSFFSPVGDLAHDTYPDFRCLCLIRGVRTPPFLNPKPVLHLHDLDQHWSLLVITTPNQFFIELSAQSKSLSSPLKMKSSPCTAQATSRSECQKKGNRRPDSPDVTHGLHLPGMVVLLCLGRLPQAVELATLDLARIRLVAQPEEHILLAELVQVRLLHVHEHHLLRKEVLAAPLTLPPPDPQHSYSCRPTVPRSVPSPSTP